MVNTATNIQYKVRENVPIVELDWGTIFRWTNAIDHQKRIGMRVDDGIVDLETGSSWIGPHFFDNPHIVANRDYEILTSVTIESN